MSAKGSHLLSLEERIEIEKFLKRGSTYGHIADILGRSHSCIKQEVMKNGGRSKYTASAAHDAFLSRDKAKRRKLQKNMSDEQVEIIKKGIEQGFSRHKISELSGVSEHVISTFIKQNNIKYTVKNYTSLESRITNLEMQVEILIETLKELYGTH